ncbi:hypothetical protein [Bradyrhizobium sp. LTSP857]|uniref:hypothetical protein n=1 Tax=Bradyrhizobium sp. LTSP857 TaxID=1619231 RepID=UPI0005D2B2AA|nr:hypothetical protein [Bradyrhizobium sp. LTSP857]
MFDDLMILLVVLSFGFPAIPWFFGARWAARGVWLSTGFAVVILLCFFPILFSVACGACGQGAIAIFMLGPIWIASALLTVTSAAWLTTNSRANFRKTAKALGGNDTAHAGHRR